MKYDDIIETKTISSGDYSKLPKLIDDEVNKLLDMGWIIIDTYTTSVDSQNEEIHYVLGITEKVKIHNCNRYDEPEYEFCF